jgi:hypothetical protein
MLLFLVVMPMDSATLITTHSNFKNWNAGSFALQMLRRFSQWFSSFKQQALDCLKEESVEHALLNEWASSTQLKATKAKLLENDGSLFHKMLALDQKGIVLPHEIGI